MLGPVRDVGPIIIHHHYFVYRLLLIIVHTKARVRRYQQLNPSSISYPVHLPSLVRTLPCHHSHTSSISSYSPLPHTTHHLQTSALRNPIIGPFTFHMPKPSQPATTNNSIHTFNT